MLSVTIGSDIEVRLNGVLAPLSTRHERAIVARLASIGGKSILRTRLAKEHWPDSGQTKANLSLRQRLHCLKNLLPNHLELGREWVALKQFEVHFEDGIGNSDLLEKLNFDWILRYRLMRMGLIADDIADIEQPSEKSELSQSVLESWFRSFVFNCEAAQFPYPGTVTELRFRANLEKDHAEAYALWMTCASFAAVDTCHRSFCGEIALENASLWRSNPGMVGYAALAYESAGNAAHAEGRYLDCLNYLAAAKDCYQRMGVGANRLRMKFKIHRVQIDIGMQKKGTDGLVGLYNDHGNELPGHVRKLICDNLIFAFANCGKIAESEAAYNVSVKQNSLQNLAEHSNLQEGNVTVKHLENNDLTGAARSLLLYQTATFNPSQWSASNLFWTRATEVLAASGDFYHSSIAYSLLQNDAVLTGQMVSPCNQNRLHTRAVPLLNRSASDQWQLGKHQHHSISTLAAHESVVAGLTRLL